MTFPKGRKNDIKAHADTQGESVNAFIIRAVYETMARERKSNENTTNISKLANISSPTAAKDEEPVTPKQKYQYRIFTEQEAAKIDLNRLLSDNRYQVEIAMDFGMEVLSTLVNTARQQSEPSTSS